MHNLDCGTNMGSHDGCVCHWELKAVRVCIEDVESGFGINAHMQHARYVEGKFM